MAAAGALETVHSLASFPPIKTHQRTISLSSSLKSPITRQVSVAASPTVVSAVSGVQHRRSVSVDEAVDISFKYAQTLQSWSAGNARLHYHMGASTAAKVYLSLLFWSLVLCALYVFQARASHCLPEGVLTLHIQELLAQLPHYVKQSTDLPHASHAHSHRLYKGQGRAICIPHHWSRSKCAPLTSQQTACS